MFNFENIIKWLVNLVVWVLESTFLTDFKKKIVSILNLKVNT
jgi:hypothetical protein